MTEQAQNNINDILDNIKEVITTGKVSNSDNDVLVLTERVDTPAAAKSNPEVAQSQQSVPANSMMDDMAALMEQMSNQSSPEQQAQASQTENSAATEENATLNAQSDGDDMAVLMSRTFKQPEPVGATVANAYTAVVQERGDDMAALMEQMSKQPEPQPTPAVVTAAPEVAAKAPSEEKDILEKIDEDTGWGAALNEQKNLTSQDFSAPAFNQLKDNEKPDSLLSEQVAVKSMEKLKSLVEQLEPKPNRADSPSFRAGVTLEDLVMEAMKPEISKWLNDNLPQLVSSIVEKEIKKIIPR